MESGANGVAGALCYTALPNPKGCWLVTGHFRDAGLQNGECTNNGRWWSCQSTPVHREFVGEYQAVDVRDNVSIPECKLCPQLDGTMAEGTVSDIQ